MRKIDELIERMKKIDDGKITVFFKDGSKTMLEPVECIDLIINSPDTVERFEVNGGDNGQLPDLFNDLLTKEVYHRDVD